MNNIFDDLKQKFANIKDARTKTAGKQLLNALEKERLNAAKLWLFSSIILFVASALTIYMGYKYYFFAFQQSFPSGAYCMSIGLSLVVEIAKVFLAYAVLSGIVFGWAFKKWTTFFAYSFWAALAFGAYWWSYTTSTEGIAIYAKEVGTDNEKAQNQNFIEYLKEGTSSIDASIAQLKESDLAALNMKTKRGKLNWYAQQTISTNASTLSSLQEEKNNLVKTLTDRYNKDEGRSEAKVNILSEWVMQFGGDAEWAVLFCLLAMVFADKDDNEEITGTETARKVAEKIRNHHATLSAEDMEKELSRAATMNGKYRDAPLGKE